MPLWSCFGGFNICYTTRNNSYSRFVVQSSVLDQLLTSYTSRQTWRFILWHGRPHSTNFQSVRWDNEEDISKREWCLPSTFWVSHRQGPCSWNTLRKAKARGVCTSRKVSNIFTDYDFQRRGRCSLWPITHSHCECGIWDNAGVTYTNICKSIII